MNRSGILNTLLDSGLQLWAEGQELCFRGPKKVLTPELRDALRESKPELVARLGQFRKHASVSPGQRRLHFLDRLAPGSTLYHIPCFWKLEGRVDPSTIENAIRSIVARHEPLRTTFREIDGSVYQVVDLRQSIDLEITRDEQPEPFKRRWMDQPLDLAEGPLFKCALLPISDSEALLALLVHHSIFDGRSVEVFLAEFAREIRKRTDGEPPIAETPTTTYADLAIARGNETEDTRRDLDYWRDRLRGDLPEAELPTDFPRPPARSDRGERLFVPVDRETVERLRSIGASEGATLYMTALAVFAVLLKRYGSTDEVMVGTPVSGRSHPDSHDLIGFFVNTLALRLDTRDDPRFRQFLARIRESTLADFAHQETPFEKLVEELNPSRDPGRSPLFQVMFSLQHRLPDFGSAGLSIKPEPISPPTSKFDLWLSLAETATGWHVALEFSADLFTLSTAERIAGHYTRLMTETAASPDLRLSQYQVIGAPELGKIRQRNLTATDYPGNSSIVEVFTNRVDDAPDAPAIFHGGRLLTYREVDERSDRLAARILALPRAESGIVAILAERGAEGIVAMLAILKAGMAYLPLDPSNPPERLKSTILDCGVRIVLHHMQDFEADGVVSLEIGDDTTPTDPLPKVSGTGDDPAYVIHTSGSTGVPKGVRIPHRAVLRLVINTNYVEFSADDRVAHASNPAFDASTFEIWGALLNGACLVVLDRDDILVPASLKKRIVGDGITVMFLTTSLFNQTAEIQPDTFDSLRLLMIGGEQADAAISSRIAGRGVTLVNGYGPTESTTFASFHRITEGTGPPPIGRAIANTTLHVLDPDFKVVPDGVAGELYIGGDGLAIDYWRRPGLTAERFPTLEVAGVRQRLYRTGDRVRWNRRGELEFLGRLDRQLKIRGMRIEPGEIEVALNSHPAVSASVVITREAGTGGLQLVACAQTEVSPDLLRDHLSRNLPPYMIPGEILTLRKLPLTPNGKVDRARLPLESDHAPVNDEPTDEHQKALVGIFRELLEREHVGMDDDFFSIGCHSLLCLRLIHRIESELGRTLPLAAVFEHPTVRGLARRLGERDHSGFAVRSGGTLPPVFFVYADHLIGREFCFGISKVLGEDRPFHVLPPTGERSERPSIDLEQEARHQVSRIRQTSPTGPRVLAGYCAGGWLAFEIARQLEEAGEGVELLVLVEVPSPRQPALNLIGDLIGRLGAQAHLSPQRQLALFSLVWTVRWKLRGLRQVMESPSEWSTVPKRCLEWLKQSSLDIRRTIPGKPSLPDEANPVRDDSMTMLWQRSRYRAGVYSGRIHIMLPEESLCRSKADRLAPWRAIAPNATVSTIPGGHESCVRQHLTEFSEAFAELIGR